MTWYFSMLIEFHLSNVNAMFHALFHVCRRSCRRGSNIFVAYTRCTSVHIGAHLCTVLHMLFVPCCSYFVPVAVQVQFDSVWTSHPAAESFATVELPFQGSGNVVWMVLHASSRGFDTMQCMWSDVT